MERVDCSSTGEPVEWALLRNCLCIGARPPRSIDGVETRTGAKMTKKIIFTNTKSTFAHKTKARKKILNHQVAVTAIAASSSEMLPEMKLEQRSIKSLKGLKRRARKSSSEQVERVARSLQMHKQVAPVLIDTTGQIINGHLVVEAMRSLGEEKVWCVAIDHLDENQREMLHITLNCISERGEWDLEILGPLLIDLGDIGFDLEATGFSLPELDIIMTPEISEGSDEVPEELLPEPNADPVTARGDLWLLGKHRLLCGDSTKQESYVLVLDGGQADCVFTDIPRNIPIAGFVSGLGKTKHEDFQMAAGEMTDAEFAEFTDVSHRHAADHLKLGGVFFSCIDWRSVHIVMSAGMKAGLRHINTAFWNKGSGGMGTLYRSAHEIVVVFCKGEKLAVNNVELGKHGRDRTNVWSYPGANKAGSSAGKALKHHPTPKPVEMVEDALLDVTKRGAFVLDPFLGSGTTLLAAERSGRTAFGIELDPAYVEVAIRRWERLTGKQAVHAATGLTFEEFAQSKIGEVQADAA